MYSRNRKWHSVIQINSFKNKNINKTILYTYIMIIYQINLKKTCRFMCHLMIIVLIILKNELTEQNLKNVYKIVRSHRMWVGFGSHSSNSCFVSSERLKLSLQAIKIVVVFVVRLVLQTTAIRSGHGRLRFAGCLNRTVTVTGDYRRCHGGRFATGQMVLRVVHAANLDWQEVWLVVFGQTRRPR